jgi:hypothetical protein
MVSHKAQAAQWKQQVYLHGLKRLCGVKLVAGGAVAAVTLVSFPCRHLVHVLLGHRLQCLWHFLQG